MNNRTLSLADSASGPWYNLKGEEHVPSLASPCLCFEGWLVVPTGPRGLVFSAELVSTLARGAAGQVLVCEGLLKAGLIPFPPCLPGTQPPLSPASALASWALFPLLVAFLRFDLAALPTLDDLMKLGGASCQLYISSAFKVPSVFQNLPAHPGWEAEKESRKEARGQWFEDTVGPSTSRTHLSGSLSYERKSRGEGPLPSSLLYPIIGNTFIDHLVCAWHSARFRGRTKTEPYLVD